MIRVLLVVVSLLIASSVSAQEMTGWRGPSVTLPALDLARLDLGSVFPLPIETDGNIETTEWALIGQGGFYLFDPAMMCVEPLPFYTPFMLSNTRTIWAVNLVKIAPAVTHQVIVFDLDASDGVAPVSVQPVTYDRCR